jgi:hypothetical protein
MSTRRRAAGVALVLGLLALLAVPGAQGQEAGGQRLTFSLGSYDRRIRDVRPSGQGVRS